MSNIRRTGSTTKQRRTGRRQIVWDYGKTPTQCRRGSGAEDTDASRLCYAVLRDQTPHDGTGFLSCEKIRRSI